MRTSDTEAQLAVLQRCQATMGLSPQNYLTMAALCRQSGGNTASQQACLKAALRHLSQQMPVTEFELIAQVWTGCFWQIERVLSLLEEEKWTSICHLLPPRDFPWLTPLPTDFVWWSPRKHPMAAHFYL